MAYPTRKGAQNHQAQQLRKGFTVTTVVAKTLHYYVANYCTESHCTVNRDITVHRDAANLRWSYKAVRWSRSAFEQVKVVKWN